MSTAPVSRSFPAISDILPNSAAAAARPRTVTRVVRRRATREQGKALETLAHAIEYLVDEQLRRRPEPASRSEIEAGRILMRLNREVFDECEQVVPLRTRIGAGLERLRAAVLPSA
jgi:hypothetical protein